MNTCLMLRNSWGWGGVGWDVLTFVAHEHMFDVTQPLSFLLGCLRSLHLHTCSMLRNDCVSCWDVYVPCTCAHVQCYATTVLLAGMFTFLALAHMFNATQPLSFLLGCLRSLHLHTCSMLRNDCVSCWDIYVP